MDEAKAIKIAAVLTAIPRWTGALMIAEGTPLPQEWLEWWRVVAALLSLGMAVVEAFAISYVLNAWRVQRDKGSKLLAPMAIAMVLTFTVILAPYVAANVRELPLKEVLSDGWLWWVWSASVASSTGVTVIAVGYAQKRREIAEKPSASGEKPRESANKPTATVDDWREIYRGNGTSHDMTAAKVRELVTEAGFSPPSDSSLRGWAREAQEFAGVHDEQNEPTST